jgi:hypothetical protein
MNAKKEEKKIVKRGRPKKNIIWVGLGLRAHREEADLIDRAVALQAKRLCMVPSRNDFCLRASMAAAKKELSMTGE